MQDNNPLDNNAGQSSAFPPQATPQSMGVSSQPTTPVATPVTESPTIPKVPAMESAPQSQTVPTVPASQPVSPIEPAPMGEAHNNTLLWILAVVFAVILIGGGIAAYFILNNTNDPKSGDSSSSQSQKIEPEDEEIEQIIDEEDDDEKMTDYDGYDEGDVDDSSQSVRAAEEKLRLQQRNTVRRNDMSRVDTSLVQYQTNHSANLPSAGTFVAPTGNDAKTFPSTCNASSACTFVRDYMNYVSSEGENNFMDPDGTLYSLVITNNWSVSSNVASYSLKESKIDVDKDGNYTIQDNGGSAYDSHVIYIIPGGKCANDKAVEPSTNRHFAILYMLEGDGAYCLDDQ